MRLIVAWVSRLASASDEWFRVKASDDCSRFEVARHASRAWIASPQQSRHLIHAHTPTFICTYH